jgi:hypothetical protein
VKTSNRRSRKHSTTQALRRLVFGRVATVNWHKPFYHSMAASYLQQALEPTSLHHEANGSASPAALWHQFAASSVTSSEIRRPWGTSGQPPASNPPSCICGAHHCHKSAWCKCRASYCDRRNTQCLNVVAGTTQSVPQTVPAGITGAECSSQWIATDPCAAMLRYTAQRVICRYGQ